MSDLPMGWEFVNFPDIVYFQEGPGLRKYQYREAGIPFLNIRTFVDERIEKTLCKFLDPIEVEEKYQHFLVKENDILVAVSGSIGKIAIAQADDLPMMLNTSIMRFSPLYKDVLLKQFLYFFLKSEHFLQQAEAAWTGTAQKNMGPSHIKMFKLFLPPLAEQHRIIAKLDSLLDRSHRARQDLERIPKLLDRYKQAILSAAFNGDLTADWREINSKTHSLSKHFIGDIAKFIDYRGKTPTKTDSGIPLITAKNIKQGYLSLTPREYISTDEYTTWMTRGIPKINDVLITTEAPLGNVVCIDWEFTFALAQRAICLQFNPNVMMGKYASIIFQSPQFKKILNEQATGSTVMGIKASRLKKISINISILEEQEEIVKRIEKLFKAIDLIAAESDRSIKLLDRLDRSILAKAFRGELVPQDPNDEPASVLLERIQKDRSTQTKGKKVKSK